MHLENELSPHSPDLKPLDFFLWGAWKDNVYKEHHKSETDLKAAEAYVQTVTIKTCRHVIENFTIRVNTYCVYVWGCSLRPPQLSAIYTK